MAEGLTRRQLLVGTAPVVGAVATIGTLAAVAGAESVDFATVVAVNGNTISFSRDGSPGQVEDVAARAPRRDYRVGDRIVLNLDPSGNVQWAEPYCDVVTGPLDRHGNTITVGGTTLEVDAASLVRTALDGQGASIARLSETRLASGGNVTVLAKRNVVGGPRVAAVFVQ